MFLKLLFLFFYNSPEFSFTLFRRFVLVANQNKFSAARGFKFRLPHARFYIVLVCTPLLPCDSFCVVLSPLFLIVSSLV